MDFGHIPKGANPKGATDPIVGPTNFPVNYKAAFVIVSVTVTNNSDLTLWLSRSGPPSSLSTAEVPIPPRYTYQITNWYSTYIFINAASALPANQYIIIQAHDVLAVLPSAPINPPGFQLGTDAVPSPFGQSIASFNYLYRESQNLWDMQREAEWDTTDSLRGGVIPAAMHAKNPVDLSFRPIYDMATDAIPLKHVGSAGVVAYNGTDLDRWRNNQPAAVALPLAPRTSSLFGPQIVSHNAKQIIFRVYVSSKVGATTLQITFYPYDASVATGTYPIAQTAALAAGVGTIYTIPFGPATYAGMFLGAAFALPVPRLLTFSVTPSDANSVTYAIDYYLCL